MIQTTLQHMDRFQNLNSRFAEAFKALRTLANEPFQEGIHAVDGDAVYINALQYDTQCAEQSMMEAHRRYIDVMLLLEGEEEIAVCDTRSLRQLTAQYDPEDDASLAKLQEPHSILCMHPGDVAILFPEDAHAPGIQCGIPSHVRKLIAKVGCQ